MHDHHHGGGAVEGALSLFPVWVLVLGVLAMAVVTASHTVHLITMRSQARAWHATHLLMGVGMLYMFAPWAGTPGNLRAWQYVFALAAAVVIGWIGLCLQRGDQVNVLWLLSAASLLGMVYMFYAHRGHGTPALTYAVVALYLAETAAWSQGWLTEAQGRRQSAVPFAVGSGRSGVRAEPLAGMRREVCVCGAVMALAMGYMFLGMDLDAAVFFGQAFSAGTVTEQTLWAGALIALAVLVSTPNRAGAPSSASPSASPSAMSEEPSAIALDRSDVTYAESARTMEGPPS